MSKFSQMTDEQYMTAMDEFYKKYDAPLCEPVKVLNLVMRREFAEAILRGEKKVEIRSFSDHYFNRLTDKKVDKWMTDKRKSEGMDMEAFEEFMCSTRPVEKIHFHNYNNTWYLDVTCAENALVGVTRETVEYLQSEYGFHEFDEMLKTFEAKESENRPLYYYFVIGEVLETNIPSEK